jgi:hypothetical protein
MEQKSAPQLRDLPALPEMVGMIPNPPSASGAVAPTAR